jgi:hypothetical protein
MPEAGPWSRLSTNFLSLFDPVDPRAPPPETPPEFKEWMLNVSAVTTICMAYSGWQENIRLQHELVAPPRHLPPALHGMFVRNQQGGHIAKVASKALTAGWHALLFGGLFFGLDGIVAIARDRKGKENTAVGGAVTGTLYGTLLPGGLAFKGSRAALGAVVGSAAGMAVGWLHHDAIPCLEPASRHHEAGAERC